MAIFGKSRQENEPPKPHQPLTTPSSTPGPRPTQTSTVEAKTSVIGKTLFIKGNVFSDEEVFIEGKIEGQLHIKHRVIIGTNGLVNADIEANEIIIKGTVNGNVKGNSKVEIVPNGVLNGNILSPTVKLAEGAVFKGSVDMTKKE